MNTTTVVPAYGRDYSSEREALAAWEAGIDFRVQDVGSAWNDRYCSVRDQTRGQLGQVKIRFNRRAGFVLHPLEQEENHG